jgi:hypothetical protein
VGGSVVDGMVVILIAIILIIWTSNAINRLNCGLLALFQLLQGRHVMNDILNILTRIIIIIIHKALLRKILHPLLSLPITPKLLLFPLLIHPL